MHRNQNFEFLYEKVAYVFRLLSCWNFFLPFLFLLSDVSDVYLLLSDAIASYRI